MNAVNEQSTMMRESMVGKSEFQDTSIIFRSPSLNNETKNV